MTLSLCAQQRVTLQGPAEDLSAGPVSLPPGIKTGNILPLMASDSRLNCTGVLKESVVISAKAQQVPEKEEKNDKRKWNIKYGGDGLWV